MKSPLPRYDSIGSGYNSRRSADERILARLVSLLDQATGARILDIGAGTGNYTKALASSSYEMWAIEPSKLMIDNASDIKNIHWHIGVAEDMPFDSNFFDAAYCTLSLHHFSDQENGLREICRVLKPKGQFVIFTCDPRRVAADFWMRVYFGDLFDQAEDIFPAISALKVQLNNLGFERISAEPYLIPSDNKDGFFYSAWQRPTDYLDDHYRNGISSFRLMDCKRLETALSVLKTDIESGDWEARYGAIRGEKVSDGGYTFVTANKTLQRTAKRRR